MEYGTIERSIYVDAAPEIVFEVVSKPEHVKKWWPDEAAYPMEPGKPGYIVFGATGGSGVYGPDAKVEQFTVVEARPPRSFSFRWNHAEGESAAPGNSYLVTFDLTPEGDGTLLRMTESGFRERGWGEALVQQNYRDHEAGWDHFLPRLSPYAASLHVTP
ncbi:SRPBCC family protein [Actinoplanes sp. G11-F43]|uniref:SRPBCC family protein n=1 Tax=Actinoplanes sp. G11-F43 TaxID=3424130 RepID=UPI003D33D70B